MITVSCYSKTDLWTATLKIIAVVGLILLGVVLLFIRRPNYERFGLAY
jgi:amino acid transporter